MSYEAAKHLHRLAERDRDRADERLLRDVRRCSCPPDTYSPDGYAIFTPIAGCPVHGQMAEVMEEFETMEVAARYSLRPCTYCGDPSEPGVRICESCSREEALD